MHEHKIKGLRQLIYQNEQRIQKSKEDIARFEAENASHQTKINLLSGGKIYWLKNKLGYYLCEKEISHDNKWDAVLTESEAQKILKKYKRYGAETFEVITSE